MNKLVFVYGTLKQGFGNHRYLKNAEFIGKAETAPIYNLYDGGFPAVERNGNTAVKGEVYRITDADTLKGVYRLEGYSGTPGPHNHFYDVDTIQTPYGEAEIFVMEKVSGYFKEKIPSGVWSRNFF